MLATILTVIGVVLFIIVICIAALITIIALGLIAIFLALAIAVVVGLIELVFWLIFVNLAYGIVWILDLPFGIIRSWFKKLKVKLEKKKDDKPKDKYSK